MGKARDGRDAEPALSGPGENGDDSEYPEGVGGIGNGGNGGNGGGGGAIVTASELEGTNASRNYLSTFYGNRAGNGGDGGNGAKGRDGGDGGDGNDFTNLFSPSSNGGDGGAGGDGGKGGIGGKAGSGGAFLTAVKNFFDACTLLENQGGNQGNGGIGGAKGNGGAGGQGGFRNGAQVAQNGEAGADGIKGEDGLQRSAAEGHSFYFTGPIRPVFKHSIIAAGEGLPDLYPDSLVDVTLVDANLIRQVEGFELGSHLIQGVDPLLAEPAYAGGNTQVLVPLDGSPVVDATTFPPFYLLSLDQRGGVRRFGSGLDLGSVEKSFESETTYVIEGSNAPPGAPVSFDNVENLIVGVDAFQSVAKAVRFTAPGGTVFVSDGIFGSETIVIDRDITIQGKGVTRSRLSGSYARRILSIEAGDYDVTLKDLTFFFGATPSDASTDLERSGGALQNLSTGEVQVLRCSFSSNTADADGGAVYHASTGSLSISQSLFLLNGAIADGGAIYQDGGLLNLINSTVTKNTATGGGGLFIENGFPTVAYSTVVLNEATGEGGGMSNVNGFVIPVGSIIAGNTASLKDDVSGSGYNPLGTNFVGIDDSAGTAFVAAGGLTFASTSTTLSDVIEINPLANGGPTETHALPLGSPAIDAGLAAPSFPSDGFDLDDDGDLAEFLPLDQRGFRRIVNTVDLGAYESNPGALRIDSSTPANGSAGLSPSTTEMTIVFNQPVTKRSGLFTFTDDVTGTFLGSIDVSSTEVIVDGTTVTFPLPANLLLGTQVSLRIAAFTFDSSGGLFFGATGASAITFGICADAVFVGDTADLTTDPITGISTWREGTNSEVTGLIEGVSAFTQVQDGIDATCHGGTVFLSPQTFSITETLLIEREIRIVGTTSTTINMTAPNQRVIDITSGNFDVELNKLRIQDGDLNTENGAGIRNQSSGILTIIDSTLTGNETTSGNGGGLFNSAGASAILLRSSIHGNSAVQGGGIYQSDGGYLETQHSTISANTASDTGGGIFVTLASADIAQSSLVTNQPNAIQSNNLLPITRLANTVAVGATSGTSERDVGGTGYLSEGVNFVGVDGSNGNVFTNGIDLTLASESVTPAQVISPFVEVLSDANPTLQSGPLVNAGDNSMIPADRDDYDRDGDTTELAKADQLGRNRVHEGQVDIGATEGFATVVQTVAPRGGPVITSVDFQTPANFLIEFQSAPGVLYRIFKGSDLMGFQPYATIPAIGSSTVYEDEAASATRGFYQIEEIAE